LVQNEEPEQLFAISISATFFAVLSILTTFSVVCPEFSRTWGASFRDAQFAAGHSKQTHEMGYGAYSA
jgi:hypothetical protein